MQAFADVHVAAMQIVMSEIKSNLWFMFAFMLSPSRYIGGLYF
jgi:hypothetical protein